MNRYGIILDHFSFDKCLTNVTTQIIQPLTRLVFQHIALPLDSHEAVFVEYAMEKLKISFMVCHFTLVIVYRDKKLDFHVDDATVTLNVCLGTELTGGELYFGGVRCSSHVNETESRVDEMIYWKHQVGMACLHVGNHQHRALPIASGRRLNLILWVGYDPNIEIHA